MNSQDNDGSVFFIFVTGNLWGIRGWEWNGSRWENIGMVTVGVRVSHLVNIIHIVFRSHKHYISLLLQEFDFVGSFREYCDSK